LNPVAQRGEAKQAASERCLVPSRTILLDSMSSVDNPVAKRTSGSSGSVEMTDIDIENPGSPALASRPAVAVPSVPDPVKPTRAAVSTRREPPYVLVLVILLLFMVS
jgi:hypothetical protein